MDAKTGKVKIPGFYQDVVEPTKAEIKSFLQSGFQVNRFKQAYGFKSLRTQEPAEVMRRIWPPRHLKCTAWSAGITVPG